MSSLHTVLKGKPDRSSANTEMFEASSLPSPPQELVKPLDQLEDLKLDDADLSAAVPSLEDRKKELETKLSQLKQAINRQELTLCKNRAKMGAFTKYFRSEREGMANAWRHYMKVDARAIIALHDLKSSPEFQLQSSLSSMINRLAAKYPRYQVYRAHSLGKAVDSAISTMEVIMEDAEMLKFELAKVEKDLAYEEHLQSEMKAKLTFLRQVVRQVPTLPEEQRPSRLQPMSCI